MAICTLCKSGTTLDDIAVGDPAHRCICLRCFRYHTGSLRPLPRRLRRDIEDALVEADDLAA